MRALRERDDACFETALPVAGASPKDQFYDLAVCHGPHERSYSAFSKSEIPASRGSMPSGKRSEISPVWTERITPPRSRR